MTNIRLMKPYISFEEVESSFKEIFESGMLTKGRNVERFSADISSYTGAKKTFLTTSATTALSLSLKLLNIKEGDEVIVSDFSFPATANVVEDLGAIPIFADVDLHTFNMLPAELERNISRATKAVIFVDALGNLTGLNEIKEICKAKGLPLIEDAACAMGSSLAGVKSGNISDITCFSFHPRKLLTTGEGGAICTNKDELLDELEIKLNHGAAIRGGKIDFIDFGYNYRMSELQASMGRVQLAKLDDIIAHRTRIKNQYAELLTKLGFVPQKIGDDVVHNVQSIVFLVPQNIDRNSLIVFLASEGVETTIGTYCLSNTTYNKRKYSSVQKNSSFLEENTLTLPCYAGVDVEFVVDKIRSYFERK